ncbi:ABC transporter permease [Pseudonocardiaceae bacterium YIM PH 21723]|nr:ABC transporter permease [Pseudonocardiaceae bacterium YIM PH 21723]
MTTTINTVEEHLKPQPATEPRWQGAQFLTQVAVMTGRSLKALKDPRMILMAMFQPLIMLTLFSQVFKSMTQTPAFQAQYPGVDYINFLLPAILMTTGVQAAMWSGGGLANDLKNGVLNRFRAMPVSMLSVLIGRSLYDVVRNAIQLSVLAIAATVVLGYRGSLTGTVAAIALSLFVGWGVSWLFLALATWLRNVEVMQMVGMMAIFPLMFASSAYVPLDGLPGWLRVVAQVNPLSYAVDAGRGLALGTAELAPFLNAAGIAAAFAVIGMVFAARGIRKP